MASFGILFPLTILFSRKLYPSAPSLKSEHESWQKFLSGILYIFTFYVWAIYLAPFYETIRFDFMPQESNALVGFFSIISLRLVAYSLISKIDQIKDFNPKISRAIVEAPITYIAMFLGLRYETYLWSLFIFLSLQLIFDKSDLLALKNYVSRLRSGAKVLKFPKQSSIYTASTLCPIEYNVGKFKPITLKKMIPTSLKIYIYIQSALLCFLTYKIIQASPEMYPIELVIYGCYFLLSLSSIARCLESRKLVRYEFIRHIIFIVIETSYWSDYGIIVPISMLSVGASFLSLNWYMLTNSKFSKLNLKAILGR